MTTTEINAYRNERGIFTASNESAQWYAISRDGIHMIQFRDGKIKFYSEQGFAKRLTKLINTGE